MLILSSDPKCLLHIPGFLSFYLQSSSSSYLEKTQHVPNPVRHPNHSPPTDSFSSSGSPWPNPFPHLSTLAQVFLCMLGCTLLSTQALGIRDPPGLQETCHIAPQHYPHLNLLIMIPFPINLKNFMSPSLPSRLPTIPQHNFLSPLLWEQPC